MPANLTPEYHRAEEAFRQARSVEERIAALEEMLRVIPKHKGTDHMQADLRSRIAKLRKESARQGGRGGFSHIIPAEGAGQVALAGPPNAGKSSLVRALTNATPAVGEYPFTTREPTPGMMAFEDIAFQLIDLPPLSRAHVEPWVYDLVRHADLVWLVLDPGQAIEGFSEVQELLGPKRIELRPPGEAGAGRDGLQVVRRTLLVLTRADEAGAVEAAGALDELLERRWPAVTVCSVTGAGLDLLRRRTFEALDLIRVYTKQPGKPPDRSAPFALPRGSTVADLATRIHKELLAELRFARVWGTSAFDGQAVHRDHVLAEGDVVELHAS
jgi:ribosome-interacting GTPase 1